MTTSTPTAGELTALAFRVVETMAAQLRDFHRTVGSFQRSLEAAGTPTALETLGARLRVMAMELRRLEAAYAELVRDLEAQRAAAEQAAAVLWECVRTRSPDPPADG